MKKLRIGLDVDGFLANFTAGALRVIEEVTGRRYEEVDVTEFDIAKALRLSAQESAAYAEVISSRRGFCAGLVPYPKARQGVRRLRELGDVFCVTAPWPNNPWWKAERDSWLALHFGIDVVHHVDDKTAYEADILVDDRSKHVGAWLAAWPGRTAVFWQTLHNTSESVPWGAHATSSWEALYDLARQAALGPHQPSLTTMEESV